MRPLDEQGTALSGQILARLEEAIADGSYPEGSEVPSVRTLSAELSVNPLTVAKAYQKAVDKGWLERRRGQGFLVGAGARQSLLSLLRESFLEREWPLIARRLRLLGLSPGDLSA